MSIESVLLFHYVKQESILSMRVEIDTLYFQHSAPFVFLFLRSLLSILHEIRKKFQRFWGPKLLETPVLFIPFHNYLITDFSSISILFVRVNFKAVFLNKMETKNYFFSPTEKWRMPASKVTKSSKCINQTTTPNAFHFHRHRLKRIITRIRNIIVI